jgi:hypothetical protein
MKRAAILTIFLALLAGSPALGQNTCDRSATQSRVSVLSKAGAPVSRPSVPVRYVPLPAGACQGYNYYYGQYGQGYSGGYAPSPTDKKDKLHSPIPGLVTRPRSSYKTVRN